MKSPAENGDGLRRFCRLYFGLLLAAWFCVISFWLGPHKILFGHFRAMKPNDFAPTARHYCVPVIREMKIYQRDHGHLPKDERDMPAVFRPAKHTGPGFHRIGRNGDYVMYDSDNFHTDIEYDFTPGHEAWSVHGPFVNGPLLLPPVTLEPNAKSAYGP